MSIKFEDARAFIKEFIGTEYHPDEITRELMQWADGVVWVKTLDDFKVMVKCIGSLYKLLENGFDRSELAWTKTSSKHAPLYKDVLVVDEHGHVGVGKYFGDNNYLQNRYTALCQARITHWRMCPKTPLIREG